MEENIQKFKINCYTRRAIGFTNNTENLIIPKTFIGDGNNCTVKGQEYLVTEIENNASILTTPGKFCVRNIFIPKTVCKIHHLAFDGCLELKTIQIDPSNPYYRSICDNQVLVDAKDHIIWISPKATELIFPQSIVSVGSPYYFDLSTLKIHTIFIPNTTWCFDPELFEMDEDSDSFHREINIIIDQPKDSIPNAPWGIKNAHIYWIG